MDDSAGNVQQHARSIGGSVLPSILCLPPNNKLSLESEGRSKKQSFPVGRTGNVSGTAPNSIATFPRFQIRTIFSCLMFFYVLAAQVQLDLRLVPAGVGNESNAAPCSTGSCGAKRMLRLHLQPSNASAMVTRQNWARAWMLFKVWFPILFTHPLLFGDHMFLFAGV